MRPDAADAARDAHAGDASDAPAPQQLAAIDARARPGRDVARRQDAGKAAEHAAVDARARAVFFARPTKPRPHARRPLGLSTGCAVPALGADDAPILRAVGARLPKLRGRDLELATRTSIAYIKRAPRRGAEESHAAADAAAPVH